MLQLVLLHGMLITMVVELHVQSEGLLEYILSKDLTYATLKLKIHVPRSFIVFNIIPYVILLYFTDKFSEVLMIEVITITYSS